MGEHFLCIRSYSCCWFLLCQVLGQQAGHTHCCPRTALGGTRSLRPHRCSITPGRGSLFSDEAEVVSRRVVGTSQQCCFTLTGGCSEPWAPCSGLNHSSGSRSLTVEPGRQAAQRSSGRWHPVSRMRGLRHTGRLLTGDGEKRLWLGG